MEYEIRVANESETRELTIAEAASSEEAFERARRLSLGASHVFRVYAHGELLAVLAAGKERKDGTPSWFY